MYYLDGQFVAAEGAKISVLDLAILRGYAVFDYFRTYRGRPFHMEDHLQRLTYSAGQIGLPLPCPIEEIGAITKELILRDSRKDKGIKIALTGGVSPDQMLPSAPSLIVMTLDLPSYPAKFHTEGIRVTTTSLARTFPTCKTTNYIPSVVALQEALKQGAEDALYLNGKGEILEATTSNFFAITKDGTLRTCISDEVLIGITSEVLLRLAAPHFSIDLRPISVEDEVVEAFITASNKEIMPVAHIDGKAVGIGTRDLKTVFLQRLFKSYTSQDQWDTINISRYTPAEKKS